MNNRERFYLFSFPLSLIFLCPSLYPADTGKSWVVSMVKSSAVTIAKVVGAAVVGREIYNSGTYDPYSGTFDTSSITPTSTAAHAENRGVPVGIQGSSIYETVADRQSGHDFSRMSPEKQAETWAQSYAEKAQNYTIREIDASIKSHDEIIKTAQEEAQYRRHKGQIDQVQANENEIKMYEASKNALEHEKESRKVRHHGLARELSDKSLNKLLRNTKEELIHEQGILDTERTKYWWNKDESLVHNTERKVNRLNHKVNEINKLKEERAKSKTIHTVSTTLVITSKTAGTEKTTTTKTELVPQSGGSGGNQDPEKDPKKGPDLKGIAGVAGAKAAKEHFTGHGEGHSNPQSESHPNTSESHGQPNTKGVNEYRVHEKAQFEENKQLIEQMKKDKPFKKAQQEPDPLKHQPPHITKKTLEYHEDPSKIQHIFRDDNGHIIKDTPNARAFFNEVAHNPENYIGQNLAGNHVYEYKHPDGNQIWVEVRNGMVQNGGANRTHWTLRQILKIDKTPTYNDKSAYYTIGAGAVSGLLTENAHATSNNISPSALSQIKAEKLNPLIAERIKNESNPLPPAPKDIKPIGIMQTPEMKAYVHKRTEQLNNMTPQQRVQEIMKPSSSTIIHSQPKQPTAQPKLPTLTVHAPVAAPKASTMIASKHVIQSSSKPSTSIPSAPRSSGSSAPASRPTTTHSYPSSTVSSGGKSYTVPGGFGGYKRN